MFGFELLKLPVFQIINCPFKDDKVLTERCCLYCLVYNQITEQQGGDKSQQSRSPNTSSPELLDLGRAQNSGPTESASLRTTRVPEPELLRPGRCKLPRAGHGWFLAEQPRA